MPRSSKNSSKSCARNQDIRELQFNCLRFFFRLRFVVILSQLFCLWLDHDLRSDPYEMMCCAAVEFLKEWKSMNRNPTRKQEIWIKNYRCDKKMKSKEQSRFIENNKTIENAKMDSFRIITELFIVICGLVFVFFFAVSFICKSWLYDKMRMFICPSPTAVDFHLIKKIHEAVKRRKMQAHFN